MKNYFLITFVIFQILSPYLLAYYITNKTAEGKLYYSGFFTDYTDYKGPAKITDFIFYIVSFFIILPFNLFVFFVIKNIGNRNNND